ncbi:MAG TPA: hypothetical protein PK513_06210 [Alphaproteobacteria bacterium]|nr:hypothetical protein [Alphaproteobacteria bacterium]USO06126.1 MAG: hypothetical protein H6859_02720 [Rhodospirillales bacterium]HOO82076.1 hypothetical protein [Alphaproteobacteria bacterium]
MRWFTGLLVFFVPVAALAQDASLAVICKALPNYKTPAGVEYVQGVEGVVPADLNPLKAPMLDVVKIPIDVMLAERFQSVKIPSDLELQPNVAMISIYRDGRVEYNGQDVSGQAYSLCGKSVGIVEKSRNGQAGDDALKSQPEVIELKESVEGEVLEGQYP